MKKWIKFLTGSVALMAFATIGFAAGMSQQSLKLKKGWNLVGGMINNSNLTEFFNNGGINSMWKWDASTGSWEIFSGDENVNQVIERYKLKRFGKFQSGEGYWINAKEDMELYINGEPPKLPSFVSSSAVDTSFNMEIDEMDNESMVRPENVQNRIAQLLQNAEIITYSGEVISVPKLGTHTMNGFKLNVNNEEVVFYGLGPQKIWEQANVQRPDIGDNLTVEAFKITTDNDTVRNILISITDSDGNTLKLRDESTGLPVWAKGKIGFNRDTHTGMQKEVKYRWGRHYSEH